METPAISLNRRPTFPPQNKTTFTIYGQSTQKSFIWYHQHLHSVTKNPKSDCVQLRNELWGQSLLILIVFLHATSFSPSLYVNRKYKFLLSFTSNSCFLFISVHDVPITKKGKPQECSSCLLYKFCSTK